MRRTDLKDGKKEKNRKVTMTFLAKETPRCMPGPPENKGQGQGWQEMMPWRKSQGSITRGLISQAEKPRDPLGGGRPVEG